MKTLQTFCISTSENANIFGEILLKFCDQRGAKGCKSNRSRQELSNEDSLVLFLFTCKNRRRYSRKRASQSSFNFQAMGFNFYRAAPPPAKGLALAFVVFFAGGCVPATTSLSLSRKGSNSRYHQLNALGLQTKKYHVLALEGFRKTEIRNLYGTGNPKIVANPLHIRGFIFQ